MIGIKPRLFLVLMLACLVVGCAGAPSAVAPLTVVPWPEADALFRGDSRWLGADDAYSVDLGQGRVLWLFGDSFVAPASGGNRREAAVIRNSVAIQEGYDPSSARLTFYWPGRDQTPESFFREDGEVWFWPGDGVILDGSLIVFLMAIQPAEGPLGFESAGWTAVKVDNPQDPPDRWRRHRLVGLPDSFGVVLGSASVFESEGHVYAYGAAPDGNHDLYLVRWPAEEVMAGRLDDPQWWTGRPGGWRLQSQLAERPPPVLTQGQIELTVHYEEHLKSYLAVQTVGFGPAELAMRTAPELTGPWSPVRIIHHPREADRTDVLIYAGKAHPHLQGADLVMTYVVNTTDWELLLDDNSIYYPKFLKCNFR
jgi:hypothetical protein